MSTPAAPSPRTEVKRGANRAEYGADTVRAVLEAGTIAHVGVQTEDGPIVLPMAYGIDDDNVLIHGSVANAMMRAGSSMDVCITVTIVDGLVIARTPFHNSMNYRCVVVRGTATKIDEPEAKLSALKIINDHIVDLWDITRPPNESELKRTLVLSVPLTEASAKIRQGDPIDEPEDVGGPYWAGVLPLDTTWGSPYSAGDLRAGIATPGVVAELANRNAHRA